ncbi:MAG TPA: hypothetical protein ENN17_07140 [bacterium]|nr:hypothetical protein [bacterium]
MVETISVPFIGLSMTGRSESPSDLVGQRIDDHTGRCGFIQADIEKPRMLKCIRGGESDSRIIIA